MQQHIIQTITCLTFLTTLYTGKEQGANDISSEMEFSLLLSRSLDVIGYNQDMIRHRVDYWKLQESLDNIFPEEDFESIHAGSQTEGVVAYHESDIDFMAVYKTVICADNPPQFMHHRNLTLFETDNCDTEPGYIKLKLHEIGNANSDIAESLFESDNNTTYISSEFFTNRLMMDADLKEFNKCTPINVTLKKAGPAIPFYVPLKSVFVNDMVYCFKCYCPALLRSWLRRPRQYNWPSRNILYDISQMEPHVVPVGFKGSDTYYQEWRICFTKAEIHLIHSLNDTQIKMYIILKMVSKTILKIICPEITSYIIKNITFWMCESIPSENFTEHQLVNRICQALEFLRKCVAQNYLPSYMIPERNLLYGRIELGQKFELIDSLSSCIEDGPAALFHRLDKICGAMSLMYQEAQRAEFYRIKRNTIEKLFLLKELRGQIFNMTEEEPEHVILPDELDDYMTTALLNLVLPKWREMPNVSDTNGIYHERLRHILS